MENRFLPLFQPLQIGNLILKNRLVMAPMGENYGGILQSRSIEYYSRRAKGGVGMVTTGAIVSNSVTHTTFPHMTNAETAFNMAYLAEAVHAGGAALCVEFTAGTGRNAPDPITGKTYSASDDVDGYWTPGVKCVALTVEQIQQIMKETQESAAKCKQAGVDCINIHAHNGYLIDQFISSGWNHRTDEYGGSAENRMRFLKEYLQAVRNGVGPNFPIIIRFTVDMLNPKARQPGETEEMLKILKTLDFQGIDVDWACYECADKIFPSYYEEDACELYVTDIIREMGFNMPIFNAGNHTPETALKAVVEGKCDAILLGRTLIADPDLPNKLLRGEREEIRPCLKCNMGCLARQPGRGVSCAVNAEAGTEERAQRIGPCKKQKVVVVGGGVGGMEAARRSAERGADVVLLEKNDHLGGTALAIATPDWKYRFREYIAWDVRQLEKLGVKIVLNADVDVENEELKNADRIFVATGSVPLFPPIEGIRNKNVFNVLDVHKDESLIKGDQIVVCGGGMSGCELALELAEAGKQVSVIEMKSRFATDAAAFNGMTLLTKMIKLGVKLCGDTKVKKFTEEGVVVEKDGEEITFPADTIVHAFGIRPNNTLAGELMKKYPGIVTVIGDAKRVNCIYDAVRDGYYAATSLE